MHNHNVDIVLALEIFFLVKEPAALPAEIHRIIKPDGVLILNNGH
jgi:2-polyprenyl-3-methyl-5-hydroxy-6-metoxy-1,4-benzoquinol methylase